LRGVAVAAGFYHNLALKSEGTVVAWGTSTNPIDIGTDPNYGQSIVPTGLSNVVAIAGGGWHSLALRSDGTVVGWGRNDDLQASPPNWLSNVVAISAGAAHSLALLNNGRLVAWGINTYGQTNVPAQLTNVVGIAAGGWHNLVLNRDGTVVAWGAGGPNTNALVVCGQNIVPAGLSNVIQVAAGSVHSLALRGTGPPELRQAVFEYSFETNVFSIKVQARLGHVYGLEYKSHLNDASWFSLPLSAGAPGVIRLSDTVALDEQRFYRVREW
jgi:alpha-tubulin suppressor-like RCC1 family protein